ncbi:MAG: response regulator transcription factor [Clostridiales bacterium]|jgi:DNA-binding response OmpR family regulator|nr:response regulator transcription factor [Clostridiales bacterium]MDR2713386.1 response regulator transcription factor [Clostridiales bacterium]
MSKKTKILVVDDDEKIRKIMRYFLEKEGYEVYIAADGEEALRVIPVQQPDLILLDLMMPKVSGPEVIARLGEARDHIPIIILSAKGEEIDRIAGFRLGVDDYMTKPFSPVELSLRIKAVLRRVYKGSSKAADKPIIHGDLCIDNPSHKVTIKGEEIALTGKEYDLLLLLASNPGQVYTRMELLQRIWESDYEGDKKTVSVHIHRLRKKIESSASSLQYINTVHGIGYRFEGLPCGGRE